MIAVPKHEADVSFKILQQGRHAVATESEIYNNLDEVTTFLSVHADENEAAGKLSDQTVTLLQELGFFSLLTPKCLGGLEFGPVAALDILERLCEADGSAGWVALAANVVSGVSGAFLPETGVDVVFRHPAPIVAGQGAPRGKAVVEGSGYRLSGRWSYGSGILHSDFIHTGAQVFDNGRPVGPLTLIVPTKNVVFCGNWDVLGLRATGSVDYELDNVFVPREFTHSANAIDPLRGGSLYKLGIVGLTPMAHAAFAAGNGRRALRELANIFTNNKAMRLAYDGGESFEEQFAAAEAKMQAGRCFLYEVYREVETSLASGAAVSQRQITMMRLALFNMTAAAVEACTFAYKAAGGLSLRHSVLQRCYRDMMAAGQHRIVSNFMLRECARELLGRAEGMLWTSAGLAKHD